MFNNKFPAHIRVDNNNNFHIQSVAEHCLNVAKYASESLVDINLNNCGYLVGLLHDMGKSTAIFKNYIEQLAIGNDQQKGSVVHTFTVCKYLLDVFYDNCDNKSKRRAVLLLAYVASAHHNLYDCFEIKNNNKESGFDYRRKSDKTFEEACRNYFVDIDVFIDLNNLNQILDLCVQEIENVYRKTLNGGSLFSTNNKFTVDDFKSERLFYMGLLTRLILSSLINGDHKDTAEFMCNFQWKTKIIDWNLSLKYFNDKISKFVSNSEINRARTIFSNICADFYDKEPGIYRLNLPTGAGKTLSSFRAALENAKHFNKKRIFYIMPLLAIIEQNAGIIKDFTYDKSLVLEHHSNVVEIDNNENSSYNGKSNFVNFMLSQDWSSPIVITTLVQFLNTLFANKLSNIRRFQGLINSIIIIDEVQSVPINMLTLFNMVLNFLSKVCKCTIILCSATQPALELLPHRLLLSEPCNIVPYDANLWNIFKRTEIKFIGNYKFNTISNLLLEKLKNCNNLLFICNTKKQAKELFNSIYGIKKFHYSASMCSEHRSNVLNEIKEALKNKDEPFICIATWAIGAGVDISFEKVGCFLCGMDYIIQAAGRCNRNKELSLSEVFVVNCIDEDLSHLPGMVDGKFASLALFDDFKRHSEVYGEITSDVAIEFYYKNLYKSKNEGYMEYSVCNEHTYDIRTNLYSLLSDNKPIQNYFNNIRNNYILKQSFKSAGSIFNVFSKNTYDVVVPYGEAINLIADLNSEKSLYDIKYAKQIIKKLSHYTVNIFDYQKEKFTSYGGLHVELYNVLYLDSSFYDLNTGVVNEPSI